MASTVNPFFRRARVGRVIFATLALALVCASSARAQTVVTLTFDDGIESQTSAAAMLEAHGMRGTFYINSGTIASKPYFMTWPQVDAIAAAGHEIAGHTIDHKRLTSLTPEEQRRQVCDDASALRSRGYTITDFAYPYGAGSKEPAVQAALHDCGYVSARKVGELQSDPGCGQECPFAESLPPLNPYGFRTAPLPTGPITLANLEDWVTRAEQSGGGWVPIVFHDICDTCLDSSVSQQDFGSFLDWLSARVASGTVVKTVRQALAEGPQHPAPATAISCNAAPCTGTTLKAPATVSLSATDGGGGLGATRYTVDGSDPTTTSPQYTGPFALSATATVKFRTWDLDGNPEPARTQIVKVDAIAPTGQITSPADGASVVNGAITVKVDAADTGSGVSDVQLFVDGDYLDYARSTASPYVFTFATGALALGSHRLRALIVDAVGNHASTPLVTFTVKDGSPATSIACDGAPCPAGFVKGPVSVTLQALDGGGGLGATRYTLDGSEPAPASSVYTGPFSLTQQTTVKFRTWDAAGNPEPVRSQTIKVDSAAPTAQITSPVDGGSAVSGNLTVTVEATDAGSGVSDVELFADGDYVDYSRSKSSPYSITVPAGALPLGTHKLKALVVDALGNRAFTPLVTVTVKDGLPTTTISCGGLSCPAGYAKGPVAVTLAAIDGGAGLGATRYTLDGSDPGPSSPQYSGPLSLSDTTTLKFRSWDLSGNAEPVRTRLLKIDSVPPVAQVSSPVAGNVVRNDVAVAVDAADSGAGIGDVELFVDGDYVDYSRSKASPFLMTWHAGDFAPGPHRLKAIVTDAVGNGMSSTVVTVSVAASSPAGPPTTTIACGGVACPPGFVAGPLTVTLAAIDGGAGVGATRYTVDGTDPDATSATYAGPFTITASTTVKFRSWDSAGNAEAVRSQQIKIDSTPPTAQIISPGAGAMLSGDVVVQVNAADAESGVASVDLYVDGDYASFSKTKGSPYEIVLPAGTLAPGTHRLKVNVTDAVGNLVRSAPVTVIVGG